jgi:hypothetical protein
MLTGFLNSHCRETPKNVIKKAKKKKRSGGGWVGLRFSKCTGGPGPSIFLLGGLGALNSRPTRSPKSEVCCACRYYQLEAFAALRLDCTFERTGRRPQPSSTHSASASRLWGGVRCGHLAGGPLRAPRTQTPWSCCLLGRHSDDRR